MKHLTNPTKTFVALVIAILLLILFALWLITQDRIEAPHVSLQPNQAQAPEETFSVPAVDTSTWVDYQDPNFPLLIKVPEDWSITNRTIAGLYTLVLAPEARDASFRIFISENGLIGMSGLPSTDIITASNHNAIVVDNNIYGIKADDYYYTFDGTLSNDYIEEFFTIVNNVKFE